MQKSEILWKTYENQVNFVNVGSYYVRFKVESLNYVNYESSVTYNINPITFDLTKITATNPIFTYDGTAKTFTAQYNGTILGGANVKVEYQVNDGEWTETPVSRIDVCQFSVKYRLSAANYQVPTEVSAERKVTLGLRWLVSYSRLRKEKAQLCRSQNRTISQKSIADRDP